MGVLNSSLAPKRLGPLINYSSLEAGSAPTNQERGQGSAIISFLGEESGLFMARLDRVAVVALGQNFVTISLLDVYVVLDSAVVSN